MKNAAAGAVAACGEGENDIRSRDAVKSVCSAEILAVSLSSEEEYDPPESPFRVSI